MDSFGKFCSNKDLEKHKEITSSSNEGHGICCKPDYNGEECAND